MLPALRRYLCIWNKNLKLPLPLGPRVGNFRFFGFTHTDIGAGLGPLRLWPFSGNHNIAQFVFHRIFQRNAMNTKRNSQTKMENREQGIIRPDLSKKQSFLAVTELKIKYNVPKCNISSWIHRERYDLQGAKIDCLQCTYSIKREKRGMKLWVAGLGKGREKNGEKRGKTTRNGLYELKQKSIFSDLCQHRMSFLSFPLNPIPAESECL